MKVCGYRDARADGAFWWVETPFASDVAQVKVNFASLEAKGGGDDPESLLDALWKLAKTPAANRGEVAGESMWRHHREANRFVIVFTDASCHRTTSIPEAPGAGFDDVAREVMASRLRLSVYCPEADCYSELAQMDRCEIEFVGYLSDTTIKLEKWLSESDFMGYLARQLRRQDPPPGIAIDF